MQSLLRYLMIPVVLVGIVLLAVAQQTSKPTMTIAVSPPEPITGGACTTSTFGYLDLNGKTSDFTEEELGKMILPALRQGYVLTIYPPTKRGIFVNQECHGSKK
jgi:hypothetical protein